MIENIEKNVWKLYYGNFGSNCYLIKTEGKNIMVDAGGEENMQELISDLKKIKIRQEEIDVVLLTHFHYDHIGNLSLFSKSIAYASEEEINNFKREPFGTVLNENFIEKVVDGEGKTKPTDEFIKLGSIIIKPVETLKLKSIKVIKVPGHTRGSIAFYMPKEKILFSGDTLFEEGIGRTDLPTSVPEKMEESLNKLKNLNYKILCAGH